MSVPDERPDLALFRFDRAWVFEAGPDQVWDAVSRTEDFPRWWPWLRSFDGEGLVEGGRSTCVIRAPIPYSLSFFVEVHRIVPGRLVETVVGGDLEGPARLEIAPLGTGDVPGMPAGAGGVAGIPVGGTSVRMTWEMELRRPLLRAAARFARPVMEWGHDWVVSTGVDQFRRKALGVRIGHDRDP